MEEKDPKNEDEQQDAQSPKDSGSQDQNYEGSEGGDGGTSTNPGDVPGPGKGP